MGSKLYVGGLCYSVTESELNILFAEHGRVESASIIADKFPGNLVGLASWKCQRPRKPRRRSRP